MTRARRPFGRRSLRGSFFALGLVMGGSGFATDVPHEFKVPEATGLEWNKALVRHWIEEGFNGKNVAVVDTIFAEGVVVNGQKIGRAGLRRSMGQFLTAFPDLHVTITDILADQDRVGLWYEAEGTHGGEFQNIAPTGRRVRWSGADLLRIGGGRIVEARFIDDSLGLLRQLGALPSPP